MLPEEGVVIRMELNRIADKTISAYISRSQEFNEMIEAGVRAAVEKFNFKAEIESTVTKMLKDAINDSSAFRTVRDAMRQAADRIASEYLDVQMEEIIEGYKSFRAETKAAQQKPSE